MTTRQIVNMLISQGHKVSYYIRKDGGILITSIDGTRYTGAKGNAIARQMTSQSLSERRSKQLKSAAKIKKQLRTADVPLKEEWRRVRELWNERFKRGTKIRKKVGNLGWKGIQYAYTHYGEKEAYRRLSEAEKYISGIAYSKNVELLSAFVLDAGEKLNSQVLKDLAKDIIRNAYVIREEWLNPAYEELYKLNQGKSPEDVASSVKRILRIVS